MNLARLFYWLYNNRIKCIGDKWDMDLCYQVGAQIPIATLLSPFEALTKTIIQIKEQVGVKTFIHCKIINKRCKEDSSTIV